MVFSLITQNHRFAGGFVFLLLLVCVILTNLARCSLKEGTQLQSSWGEVHFEQRKMKRLILCFVSFAFIR